MTKRRAEIDTKLLLHAVQRTANFESLLSRRFTGVTLTSNNPFDRNNKLQEEDTSNNPFEEGLEPDNPFFESTTEEKVSSSPDVGIGITAPNLNPFHGIISKCFESYLVKIKNK